MSDWPALLDALRRELDLLDADERLWLAQQVERAGALQAEIDALFLAVGGPTACAGCDGACCDCGRHHLTLTNLLGYLLDGADPPTPDFSRACPFLGDHGCLLPVARRPYNCITFFCDILDAQLNAADRAQLADLDRRLRAVYEEVARRFPLASLRGLWIALERAGGRFLLRARPESC